MRLEYLAGKWDGFYTYGPDYSENLQSIKEPFILELTIDDGIITGTLVDSYTQKYFNEPATVEGTLTDRTLSLIKRYPYLLGVDENDEIIIDKSLPSLEIHYIGQLRQTLFSRNLFVQGTWDISGSFRDENGNANYYTYDGNWEMRRAK